MGEVDNEHGSDEIDRVFRETRKAKEIQVRADPSQIIRAVYNRIRYKTIRKRSYFGA